jgi:hypothetical protein
MSLPFDQGKSTLKCLLLALLVLFAQQAAQLHALAHAQDQLAQPHHQGKPVSHPIEQCVAFHAIDSALVATAALQDFDFPQTERATWHVSIAQSATCYRLPARAPPQVV